MGYHPDRFARQLPPSLFWLSVILPAFVYAVIVTRFSLNLLAPEYGWKLYNAYATALLHGRLDLPIEAASGESFIVAGKVYVYYGMLPAIIRMPIAASADLATTSVSRLLVLLSVAGSAASIQLSILRLYQRFGRHDRAGALFLLIASICIWFGSGSWMLIQQASFYNEPFALGLFASCGIIFLLCRDVLVKGSPPGAGRLLLYALLAGSTVFSRQTMAVSLYGVVALLGLWKMLEGGVDGRRMVRGLAASLPTGVILLAAGIAYLWTNHLRFGGAGSYHPIANYGYYIINQSMPERLPSLRSLESIRDVGTFHIGRIVPNLAYALTGLPGVGGAGLRQKWIAAWGGGLTMAYHAPYRLLIGWAASWFLAALGIAGLLAHPRRLLLIGLLICFSAGALLQLAYANSWNRYYAEYWPPVAFLICIAFTRPLPQRRARALSALAIGLTVVMLAYNIHSRNTLILEMTGPGSLNAPVPQILYDAIQRTAEGISPSG